MKTLSQKNMVENHENKKVYFTLNEKLKAGNLDQLKLMLNRFPKWDRKKLLTNVGIMYESPLNRMINYNKLEFVKYLVESCGLDVNTDDTLTEPPLWCAYDRGYMHIVKYLLSKGANTSIPYGLLRDERRYLLFEACRKRQMSLVKFLLEKKLVDVNQKDGDKNTCAFQLFLPKREIRSIIRGKGKVPPPSKFLRLLISHGLDLNHENDDGEKLLQFIIDRRNIPSLRLLEKQGEIGCLTANCNGIPAILYAAMDKTGDKVVDYYIENDQVKVADKIYAANVLASTYQWGDLKQTQYFIKAIQMRNEAWKDFDYAEYKEKKRRDCAGESKKGEESKDVSGKKSGETEAKSKGKGTDVKVEDNTRERTLAKGSTEEGISTDIDPEEDDDCDDEDVEVPVYLDVMANTEEELKNIFDSLLHINIYVVKILIHTWKKFKNIQLEFLLSEMQEDMHLNLELGRKNFLLPLLMAFVTRFCHRGLEHHFHPSLNVIAMVIRRTKFDSRSYRWILRLVEKLISYISIHARPDVVLHQIWADDDIIYGTYGDNAAVLKLRLIQIVEAILKHRSEPCKEMIGHLREIINIEKKHHTNSASLLHAAVMALPLCKSNIVKLLLGLGASVNHLDEFGTTPIYHLAAFCGLPQMKKVKRETVLEILNLLLHYGAHLDYCDTEGVTAVDFLGNNYDVRALDHQSLQCLAAREVHRMEGVDEDDIPEHLKEIVRRHNPLFRETVKIHNYLRTPDGYSDVFDMVNGGEYWSDEDNDEEGDEVLMPFI